MGYPHIALLGRARSGKDTVAARLVTRHAYTRVAFADPLKDMSLSLDPIVAYEPSGYGPLPTRLSAVVQRIGWERAKDEFPEVRRTLQRAGQSMREHDAGHWLSLALDKVAVADTWNLPVVVTDCRYPNEAAALKARGFKLVRVTRPGVSSGADSHESETALDGHPADVSIANVGTLDDLNSLADALT
ncbi:deoxynucleotide monophosphate kinase family protein [Streptomyces sp. O3]